MSGNINETSIGAFTGYSAESGEQQGAAPEPQRPEVLWIGCSDSRSSSSNIFGCSPGRVFVHRNIANMIPQGDTNSHSVIQFALEALKVRRIIVCGHTHCGAIEAVLGREKFQGPLDRWLQNLREVRDKHWEELKRLPNNGPRAARLTQLNVLAQVENLKKHESVLNVANGLRIQGWVYNIVTRGVEELNIPSKP